MPSRETLKVVCRSRDAISFGGEVGRRAWGERSGETGRGEQSMLERLRGIVEWIKVSSY